MIYKNIDDVFEHCLDENGMRKEIEIEFFIDSQKVIKKCRFKQVDEINEIKNNKIVDGYEEIVYLKSKEELVIRNIRNNQNWLFEILN